MSRPGVALEAAALGERQRRLAPAAERRLRHRPAVLDRDLRREQVHRRRAHEARDEDVGRVVVDLLRRAELLHVAGRTSPRSGSRASAPRSGRG